MKAIYTMWGAGAMLEVFEDKLAITPKGLSGFFFRGLKGTKTIPFFAISAIQFKKSGLTKGYLQFTLPGGNESKRGVYAAVSDENTFMFAGQNKIAIEIKDYIEKRMHELRQPQSTTSNHSIADELQKLVDIKAKGILSEEEFQAAKRRIIG